MKRRNFVKKAAAGSAAVVATGAAFQGMGAPNNNQQAGREYYELRVYHLKSRGKLGVMENHLKGALIPAMERAGSGKIGVFTEYGFPEPPRLYVLITYPSIEVFHEMPQKLANDKQFQKDAEGYHKISVSNPVYEKIDSSFMQAFKSIPTMEPPKKQAGIYELRVYESYNEDAGFRKIAMFDDEELPLFRKIGLHPLFFGRTIIGQNLPSLTYMLHFEDMEERDRNWKIFVDHPEWKEMSGKAIYADTVSKVNKLFLEATDYSQI